MFFPDPRGRVDEKVHGMVHGMVHSVDPEKKEAAGAGETLLYMIMSFIRHRLPQSAGERQIERLENFEQFNGGSPTEVHGHDDVAAPPTAHIRHLANAFAINLLHHRP